MGIYFAEDYSIMRNLFRTARNRVKIFLKFRGQNPIYFLWILLDYIILISILVRFGIFSFLNESTIMWIKNNDYITDYFEIFENSHSLSMLSTLITAHIIVTRTKCLNNLMGLSIDTSYEHKDLATKMLTYIASLNYTTEEWLHILGIKCIQQKKAAASRLLRIEDFRINPNEESDSRKRKISLLINNCDLQNSDNNNDVFNFNKYYRNNHNQPRVVHKMDPVRLRLLCYTNISMVTLSALFMIAFSYAILSVEYNHAHYSFGDFIKNRFLGVASFLVLVLMLMFQQWDLFVFMITCWGHYSMAEETNKRAFKTTNFLKILINLGTHDHPLHEEQRNSVGVIIEPYINMTLVLAQEMQSIKSHYRFYLHAEFLIKSMSSMFLMAAFAKTNDKLNYEGFFFYTFAIFGCICPVLMIMIHAAIVNKKVSY